MEILIKNSNQIIPKNILDVGDYVTLRKSAVLSMMLIKTFFKDTSYGNYVKYTQATKNSNQNPSSSCNNNYNSNYNSKKQSDSQRVRGNKRNQGGQVKQVTDTNQTPPGYLPTVEYESSDEIAQDFHPGLEFLKFLLEAH